MEKAVVAEQSSCPQLEAVGGRILTTTSPPLPVAGDWFLTAGSDETPLPIAQKAQPAAAGEPSQKAEAGAFAHNIKQRRDDCPALFLTLTGSQAHMFTKEIRNV
jgi:hypothetical protein